MATCIKCSASIPENSLFCNICGAKQELCCPACGAALPAGSRFCNLCGAPVSGAKEPEAVAKVCATRPFSKEWEAFMNRGVVVGNDKYHFMRRFDDIYRIDIFGTVTKVPEVPYGNVDRRCPLAWAEDKLWYAVKWSSDNTYCLYTLDPETLTWSLEAKIEEKSISASSISLPYVTPDYLWFTADYSYYGGSTILVLSRKTRMDGAVEAGRVDSLSGEALASVGENQVWVKNGTASHFMNWWRRDNGYMSQDARIKPLLPLIAELSGVDLTMDDQNEFAEEHILYIDFEQELVYFTCNAEDPWGGKGYTLPFGAAELEQAELFWAGVDSMNTRAVCNWRHCVGTNDDMDGYKKRELILQKADGTTMPLGLHELEYHWERRDYKGVILANDMVYVDRYCETEGRYIIRPGEDKPEFQKLKFE